MTKFGRLRKTHLDELGEEYTRPNECELVMPDGRILVE